MSRKRDVERRMRAWETYFYEKRLELLELAFELRQAYSRAIDELQIELARERGRKHEQL